MKKQVLRKALSLLLAVIMVVGLLPTTAQAATVTSVVYDTNGNTVAGATVTISWWSYGTQSRTLTTDSNGAFTFSNYQYGRTYTLTVSCSGYETKEISGWTQGDSITITPIGTQTTTAISVVSASDGVGIQNASVTVYEDGVALQTAATDANGIANITYLRRDGKAYTVTAGHLFYSEGSTTLDAGDTLKTLQLTPYPTTTTTFTVTDETNTPVSGATVTLYENTTALLSGTTDATGQVSITYPSISGKTYSAQATHTYYTSSSTATVTGSSQTLVLSSLPKVTVTVINGGGTPLMNSEVSILQDGTSIASGFTDENGQITLTYSRQSGATYSVLVEHNPYADNTTTLSADTSDLTVTMTGATLAAYRNSESSSSGVLYYTTDGVNLRELAKGETIYVARYRPIAFYVKGADGYAPTSTFRHGFGTSFDSISWNSVNPVYSDINNIQNPSVGNNSYQFNADTCEATQIARSYGFTHEFHYSNSPNSCIEFEISATPVTIQVEYLPGASGVTGMPEDNNSYRHPSVTDDIYASYLTSIAIPETRPERAGYAFAGWKFNVDGNIYWHGETWDIEDLWSSAITTEVTYSFTAQWVPAPGKLTVTKTFSGLPTDVWPADFAIEVKGTGGNTRHDTLTLSNSASFNSVTNTYTWILSDLEAGVYVVSEQNNSVTGYNLDSSSVTGATETVAAGGETTVSLSNVYSLKTYQIIWKNEDGTTLETDDDVPYGSTPVYNGATPTKESDAQYSYSFDAWTPSVGPISGEIAGDTITYTATFTSTVRTYTVTWINENGTELETDTDVPYGTTPTYNGLTPTKESTQSQTFAFAGWTPAVSAVTGDTTYTATFTSDTRTYTVTWFAPHLAANADLGVVEVDTVPYNGTPEYNGPSLNYEDATHTYTHSGWTPAIDKVTGDVTYTATYTATAKLFTATVKVWLNPTIGTDGSISGGTLSSLQDMLNQSGVELYIRALTDSAEAVKMDSDLTGVYTAQLPVGSYEILIKGGSYTDFTRMTQERIVLPMTTTAGDTDSSAADVLFYSVTYNLDGGSVSGSSASIVEYYQRGTNVTVSDYSPTRANYEFAGWELDSDSTTTLLTGYRITDPTAGIAQPHILKANWTPAQDKVIVNLTIHHHINPQSTGTIGMNTQIGTTPLNLHLLYRLKTSSGDYWEQGKTYSDQNWFTRGTTTTGTNTYNNGTEDVSYTTKTTTVSYSYDVTDFKNLSNAWTYSSNILLDDYVLITREVTSETDTSGNVTYTVNAMLQYWPDLFTMNYEVITDSSVPASLIPTAVDLKILSWNATTANAWAPITRHQNTSVDVRLDENGKGNGSYSLPVHKLDDNLYFYRVAVVGFTLPDGTELSASGADLVSYSSTATGTSAVYQYAGGAYYAQVTITPGTANADGSGHDAVCGVADGSSYKQSGTVTVTVFVNAPTVTLDPNGGTLLGTTDPTVLDNQFRLPALGSYTPTRNDNYVFDGWYYADEHGNMTEEKAVTGTPRAENTTLIAKWKAPLTVTGTVIVPTTYTLDDQDYNMVEADLLKEITVVLVRTYPINNVVEIIQSKTISTINYTSYASQKIGVGTYTFDPVPVDGSTYQVYVDLNNYSKVFQNDPASNDPSKLFDYTTYAEAPTGNLAIAPSNSTTAVVNAKLTFVPDTFDLSWHIDASQIGAGYRPGKVGILVQCNNTGEISMDTTKWPVITQQHQVVDGEDKFTPLLIDLDANGKADSSYKVWKFHASGHAYNYSVLFYNYNGVLFDENAPFIVSYAPDFAWFDTATNGQVTNDASEPHLKVTLIPKQYSVTYELQAITPLTGNDLVMADDDTYTGSYTWSFGLASLPTPSRSGYVFQGWYLNAAGTGEQVTSIAASQAEDLTLYAKWAEDTDNDGTADESQVLIKFRSGDSNGTVTAVVQAFAPGSVSLDLGAVSVVANSGYAFDHWTMGAGTEAVDPASVALNSLPGGTTVVFNAHFEKQICVEFVSVDSNGTVTGTTIQLFNRGTAEKPDLSKITVTPVDGYAFDYWTMDDGTTLLNPGAVDLSSLPSGTTVVFKAHFAIDVLAPDNNIPDKYEAAVTYAVHNGSWVTGSNRVHIFQLKEYNAVTGLWDAVSVQPTLGSTIPDPAADMQHTTPGYTSTGSWNTPILPSTTVTSSVVYTYSFDILWHTVSYTKADSSPISTYPLQVQDGVSIRVDPNGGSWTSGLPNPSGTADTYDTLQMFAVTRNMTLQDPTREGYTFLGWACSHDDIVAPYRFTAVWQLNTYTVTWQNFNGVTLEEDLEVPHGSAPSFESLSKLTVEDANYTYDFLGWYLADDDTQTLVDLNAQTVTGNITYKAAYQTTLKTHTVTINVWLNATGSEGAGGTLAQIETVTNGQRTNLYLLPSTIAEPKAEDFILVPQAAGGAYAIDVIPGSYQIYSGKTATDAVLEAAQYVSVTSADVVIHTYYNSVTYMDGVSSTPWLVEYYKSGTKNVLIPESIPSRAGYVFIDWKDQANASYAASTNLVSVPLTEEITSAYTLTAQWEEEAKITVVVRIDHTDSNNHVNQDLANKVLALHLTRRNDALNPYAEVYGTTQSVPYGSWTHIGSTSSTYTYTYVGQPSSYSYSAHAMLAGYALENRTVEQSDNNYTVTIDLKYDPAGFDLVFHVVTAEGVPDNLVPRAVDIQLVYYDRHNGTWEVVSTFEDQSIEVVLNKNSETNLWEGTGTYHVWSQYTTAGYEGQLYLYRVAVADFDLGETRGSLGAVAATGEQAFKLYTSALGTYHPAGAYTATVEVSDLNCDNGLAAGLKGAHVSGSEQHGTVTVTVDVNPYTVSLNSNGGDTSSKTLHNLFILPNLTDEVPTRAGYDFLGWWTENGGDSTSDSAWGTQITTGGQAIMTLADPGSDELVLYARWRKQLTITGQVDIATWYMQNGSKLYIYEHDRPDTAKVQLRRAGTNAILAETLITLTEDLSGDFRTGTYTFTNISSESNGFYIYVEAINFDELYQNEPNSTGSNQLVHSTYTEEQHTVIDFDSDSIAVVNVYMVFAPVTFGLEFTVDSSAIAQAFRPSSTGVVILSNDNPQGDPHTTWSIISQQQQGSVVTSYPVSIDPSDGLAIGSVLHGSKDIWHSFDVWRRHPTGELYGYAIKVWNATIGITEYNQDNLSQWPFTVTYAPIRAWYDAATGEQSSPGSRATLPDAENPSGLVAYLVPKTYTVTYELGYPGTLDGTSQTDGDTYTDSFTWGVGLNSLPSAQRTDCTFEGWYSKDGRATGDWGSKVTAIEAGTANHVTLYARWGYTVKWVGWDGAELEVDNNVLEGETPVFDGSTPTKPSSIDWVYSFDHWSPVVAPVSGNITYSAIFSKSVRTYTVIWTDENGTNLETDENVPFGSTPTYDGTLPSKAGTYAKTYTFNGWSPAVSTVTGDVTYTATYQESTNHYTITWVNGNGDIIYSQSLPADSLPVYDKATHGDPLKSGNAEYHYTFTGWDQEIVAVTADATYTAQFTGTKNTYTITWQDEDGKTLATSTVAYGETPVYPNGTPTKTATAQYTYTFAGWSPVVTAVTGNATYTATYSHTVNTYTVVWKNGDGTVLETDTDVSFGSTPSYDGATPTKAATAQYSYSFKGWSPTVDLVTGDVTYTAIFTETLNTYTVTWKNDGGTIIKEDLNVPYGTVPTYHGSVPIKEGTYSKTYLFKGWTPEITAVTGNVTYTATYSEKINDYVITWIDGDGDLIYAQSYKADELPVYDVGKYGKPVKTATAEHSYEFNGWDKEIASVTGDATYTAQFTETVNTYTVLWKDENGEVLETDTGIAYGTVPSYNGNTPSKDPTAQYTYEFDKWSPEIASVSGDVTYTATYKATLRKYKITWQNEDGSTLRTDEVAYGTLPNYGSVPTQTSTEQYSYTFDHWSPVVEEVTGDAVYTAIYTATVNQYTVTWKDEDGSVLGTDTVAYGTTPVFGGTLPTKASSVQYTYTFAGWSPALETVHGDVTYTATYQAEVRQHQITWVDGDGSIIYFSLWPAGSIPSYDAASHRTPSKDRTAEYSYTFSGWSPALAPVAGEVTYTAQFTPVKNQYAVTWKNYDGSVLKEERVEYGTTPSYSGVTPTRPSTAQHTYSFQGWDQPIVAVTGDVVYTASYSEAVNKYTVTWKNEDGTVLYRQENVPYGTVPSYGGAIPTKEADAQYTYSFAGWNPAVSEVISDMVYTATFTGTLNTYTITWKNENGTVLETDLHVPYGTMPSYDGAAPTKDSTAEKDFVFNGWSPVVEPVTGDKTYTAVFSDTTASYTVTYTDGVDGSLVFDDLVFHDAAYGTSTPAFVGTPSRYGYTFTGWSPVVADTVTGNATYTAQWTLSTYEVTWVDENGTTLLEQDPGTVHGSTPNYDGTTPVKAGTAQYTYTFAGWYRSGDTNQTLVDLAQETVTGPVTYVAKYTSAINRYTVTYTDGVDGSELFPDQAYADVLYGAATPGFVGTPTRSGYVFTGWSPAVADTVVGDVTYIAQWRYNIVITTGSALLTKVDANDPNTPLAQAVFKLYRVYNNGSESLIGTYSTNDNGNIMVSGLTPGNYFWREFRPPAGYKLDATKHHFTVKLGQTSRTTVTNVHSSVPDAFTRQHYAYIIGMSDGTVQPETHITRAEVATILFRLLKEEIRSQYLTTENPFPDVNEGDWFNTAVSTITALGVINGCSDGTFKPSQYITRAEFAALCARFDPYSENLDATFEDAYGHWAEDEIAVAVANGWILGTDQGTFCPDQHITRAEAMTVINRVLQRIPRSADDLVPDMIEWPDNLDPAKWYYLAVQEATNSHAYDRNPNGHEYWIALTEAPNWTNFQK